MADEKKEYKVLATINLFPDTVGERGSFDKRDKKTMSKIVFKYPIVTDPAQLKDLYGMTLSECVDRAITQKGYGDNKTIISDKIDVAGEQKRFENFFTQVKAVREPGAATKKAREEGIALGRQQAEDNLAKEYGFENAAAMRTSLLTKKWKPTK